MVNQQIFLPMIPDSAPIVINISQYDYDAPGYTGRLYFNLISNGTAYDMNGATAVFQGEKPDGTTFAYPGTIVNASVVRVNVRQQMTLIAGRVSCNLVLNNSEGQVGSFNVWLEVQESATAGSDPSQTDIPALVAQAKQYADDAEQSAQNAAAWTAHPPYIGANNDWFVYDAETLQYVDSGVEALGQGIMSIVKTSTSGLVDTYMITYTGGDTTTFDVTNGAAGPQGPTGETGPQGEAGPQGETGPQGPTGATPVISVSATTDALSSDNPTVQVTKGGTTEAPSYALAFSGLKGQQGVAGPQGPTGNGIASIVKTSTSGRVDTYTITMTDGSTATFTVTNGQDGTGAGDMLKADYDANSDVFNAGGIAAYVAAHAAIYTRGTGINISNQNVISIDADSTPTSGSNKPVTSGGVFTALQDKADSNKVYETTDSAETTLDDADSVPFYDNSASAPKRITVANLKSQIGGGTNVVANPSAAATDTLQKIQIGNTVYDIEGGGTTIVQIPAVVGTSFTYSGAAQGPTITGLDNTHCTVTGATATNAGTYTLTIALNDPTSMVWSDMTNQDKTYTYTIAKKSVTIPTVSSNLTYNGTQQAPTITNPDSAWMTTSGDTEATNAGTYTVTFTLNDTTNTEWSDTTTAAKSISWSIAKASQTISASPSTVSLDGNTQTASVTVSGANTSLSATSSDSNVATASGTSSPITITAVANGSATISIQAQANSNYEASNTVTVAASVALTPTGSTVTPTDDIQTWLHCANVWDKSYTTLNEVFADSTTLLALISSNNAVDYMKRSTTWASAVTENSTAMTDIGANDYCANALLSDNTWSTAICNSTYFESVLNVKVPTMTSNTTPNGYIVSVSNKLNNDFDGFYAFDGINDIQNHYWLPSTTSPLQWIEIQFPYAVNVKKVNIYNFYASNNGYSCKDITVQGSNDGNTWTNIEDITLQDNNNLQTFNITNDQKYNRYRLNVKSNYGAAGCALSEIQYYGRA